MEQKNILLVEDNPDDVELTRRAFQKNNIRTNLIVTRDGAETIEYISAKVKHMGDEGSHELPYLVLLDLKMPKVHGLEVLKEIRGNERTKFIPVVILTSSQDMKDIKRAYQFGANSYIVKPVDFLKFIEAVQQIARYWLTLNEQPSIQRGD